MALDPNTRARIESLLQSHRVMLFMKGSPGAPQCGFSAKAIGALDSLGIDYGHVDVLSDPDVREGIKAYGDWPTIPQLYIDGDLVGGSDIVEQMLRSGELHRTLGVPEPDRTPPSISIAPAALQVLRDALGNAGGGYAVGVDVDARFNTKLQLVATDDAAVTVAVDGVPVQFDALQLRRADGLRIDWADDARGRGLVVENPNAPPPVIETTPGEIAGRVADGALLLVDVRPAEERALASAPVAARSFDGTGINELEALPRDTALAFLCHHGQRSRQAAEHFRGLGFREVHNVTGGIDAWADVDPSIGRY